MASLQPHFVNLEIVKVRKALVRIIIFCHFREHQGSNYEEASVVLPQGTNIWRTPKSRDELYR